MHFTYFKLPVLACVSTSKDVHRINVHKLHLKKMTTEWSIIKKSMVFLKVAHLERNGKMSLDQHLSLSSTTVFLSPRQFQLDFG